MSRRIVCLEPSGNLYGSEFCLLDIIRGTEGQGFAWEVVLPAGGGFDRVLRGEGIRCHPLLRAGLHRQGKLRKLWMYSRMRRLIRGMAPALVYVNQAGLLRGAGFASRGLDIPMVCQVQTLEDARLVSQMPEAQKAVKAFICNSDYIAGEAGLPAEKTCIFYQGTGLPADPLPFVRPAEGEKWRIGILGRIAESKGHYVLLEAARALESGGAGDFEVVVIGEGLTPEDTARFHEAVRVAGMGGRFVFRGYRKEVRDELAKLHVLVIPSLAEPLGRVLLDAAAAGIPTLVSGTGGLGEFSRHFGVGVPVAVPEGALVAEGVLRMLDSYEEHLAAFRVAAGNMLERLAMGPYIDAVTGVLERAARGEDVAVRWQGAGV